MNFHGCQLILGTFLEFVVFAVGLGLCQFCRDFAISASDFLGMAPVQMVSPMKSFWASARS